MNKDYVFHINWEDRHKQSYRVGFLAQLDGYFYLIIKDQENAQTAYSNGFMAIPGLKVEEIYRSQELFDFFKNRILQKKGANPCEELAETGAKSMIDSYSLEKIPDGVARKYKAILLDAYELQEKKKCIQEEKKVEESTKSNKNDDDGEFPDI